MMVVGVFWILRHWKYFEGNLFFIWNSIETYFKTRLTVLNKKNVDDVIGIHPHGPIYVDHKLLSKFVIHIQIFQCKKFPSHIKHSFPFPSDSTFFPTHFQSQKCDISQWKWLSRNCEKKKTIKRCLQRHWKNIIPPLSYAWKSMNFKSFYLETESIVLFTPSIPAKKKLPAKTRFNHFTLIWLTMLREVKKKGSVMRM